MKTKDVAEVMSKTHYGMLLIMELPLNRNILMYADNKIVLKMFLKFSIILYVKGYSSKALASALVDQPVAIYVNPCSCQFQFYKKGVFNGKCGTKPRHPMLLTGYG